jgi:hypothetical protein
MFSFSFQVVVTTDTPFRAIFLPQRNWASKEYALFYSLSLQFVEIARAVRFLDQSFAFAVC